MNRKPLRSNAPDIKFPTSREEAEKAADSIRRHCALRGCMCPSLRIEFIKPPGQPGYAHVEHGLLCPVGRMS